VVSQNLIDRGLIEGCNDLEGVGNGNLAFGTKRNQDEDGGEHGSEGRRSEGPSFAFF